MRSDMLDRVNLESADDVWNRIEALSRFQPGGVVATDGDGTLWRGDVGEDLFHAYLDKDRIEPLALDALRSVAREHGVSDAGAGADVAREIYAAYHKGRFPEERLCELMAWCFAGWARDEVQALARDVIDRGGLPSRLQPEVFRVLERVRAAGIETVLVSASPLAVVIEAGARVGFSADQVVAASPLFTGERMRAGVERPIPYANGKVIRLRERVGKHRVIYAAFGDNVFDLAMLGSARIAVAVRPKPRLRENAGAVPGLIELSPLSP